ncbi:MAG: tetratricopeptide repeat protein [Polyangiaceae bacterium]|nr:tetratricopeptide repeat protein [Polyangiaceae bacterium]
MTASPRAPLGSAAIALTALAVGAGALLLVARRGGGPRVDAAAIASALRGARRPLAAERVERACAQRAGCSCAAVAASAALDQGLSVEARAVIAATRKACGQELDGHRAEAAAREGALEDAERWASATLARQPANAHAHQALALRAHAQGDLDLAARHARAAIQAGRGASAHQLTGLVAFAKGDLVTAEASFRAMVAEDASDSGAHFNLGVVHQGLKRYGPAREAYLRALALDPDRADARHNLVWLTLEAGALAEARHHLDRLAASAPGDPRLGGLRAAVDRASGAGRALNAPPAPAP